MNNINEKQLHELFYKMKNKEKNAYEELYKNYSSLIYRIAFSILKNKDNAEDVMQNVFLKISNLSEEKLPNNYEASWLYTVTKNEAISYLRKNKETIQIEAILEKGQEKEIDEMLQKASYEKMISSLDKMEKQIVSLKVDIGLSFKEIASLLHMPIGTVQWKYYKSLNSLKLLIGNLSLFIIASILCVNNFLFKNRKKESNIKQEQLKGNIHIETEIIQGDSEKQESNKKEEIDLDNEKEQYEASVQQNVETIYQDNNNNDNVMNFVLLGITAIFLCFTIFFTIIILNHQQKNSKKTSK